MGDGFWSRPPAPNYASPGIIKRQLLESDINPQRETFSQGMVHYLPRGDAHVGLHAVKDTKTTGASYDQYLQNVQMPSFSSAEETRGAIGGVSDLHVEEPSGSMPHGFGIALGGQIHADPVSWAGPPGAEAQLPQEASKTLFVEGLPPTALRGRKDIFHPFAGFKEVRLVIKDPEHHAAGKLVLCFVDFVDTTCAMSAMNALQGGRQRSGSPFLRLQFARNPAQGPAAEHALEEMNTMS
ncbi:unnamed protein product [Spirodela intermedia]|uniref:RRM domain-containing protein n=1 Tax=Spirodela intermedia TaxID=51605 RepID=A0A7I8J349_SPIIN|nr:unnamed protein product [Spirodela intermedia]CAA6663770.1 unnamed protein product [Spirodela intermedia]